MTSPRKGREFHLASRPRGWPTAEDFTLAEMEIGEPGPGQVVVRNTYLSVDPYMRGRMSDAKSYAPPYQIGKPMDGGALGEVILSAEQSLPVGTTVTHNFGWREYVLADAAKFRAVDPEAVPSPSVYLSVLGMIGLTAYAGLVHVAELHEGDTVFVSGAAGAVGSLAGQIAKLRGAARVVGSAGSAEKVAFLVDELGFDAAFNYKDGPVAEQLAAAAPDGVDVFFDNVGGEHLEAAIGAFTTHARAALCGAISAYNAVEPPPGPRNLTELVKKRAKLQGFLVGDQTHVLSEFLAEVGPWVAEGRLKYRETVVDGFEHTVDAFLGLLRGENTGKMLVRLTD
jgi:NADPH-dependent curcumin reductase CurA